MGNMQHLGGQESVDDRGLPLRVEQNPNGWETALCVCPGERKDLQVYCVALCKPHV